MEIQNEHEKTKILDTKEQQQQLSQTNKTTTEKNNNWKHKSIQNVYHRETQSDHNDTTNYYRDTKQQQTQAMITETQTTTK